MIGQNQKKKREMHGKSLFVFSAENSFRSLCNNIVGYYLFDWTILIFICISTINLAIESPLDNPQS